MSRENPDLLDLLTWMDEPPLVAPQTYTTDIYPVAEFVRSREAWIREHGSFGSVFKYPGWQAERGPMNVSDQPELSGHGYTRLTAWVPENPETPVTGPGQWHVRAVCEPCGWCSPIRVQAENTLNEAGWLDHAWPGWRDLPTVPPQPQEQKARAKWLARVTDLYPDDWGRPGAPIVTERQGYGLRSVPGRSPWGGFDLAPETTPLGLPADRRQAVASASRTPPEPTYTPPPVPGPNGGMSL